MPSILPRQPESAPPLITVDEFRERFGYKVGRSFIYEAVNEGRIKNVRINRKILILATEVEEWPLREVQKAA